MSPPVAGRLADDWRRYVHARRKAGKSPESTAEHIARFERQHLAHPWPQARDPERRVRRKSRTRTGAGEARISARGIPYRQCARGTRLQALMFPKTHYTLTRARAWAQEHEFVLRKVEESPNWVRVQLVPSTLFEKGSFRNIEISERHHVRGIIGCPRAEIAGRSTRRGVRGVDAPLRRLEVERRRRVA